MVDVVKMEEFYQSTFGGRPCQLDMSIYVGKEYDLPPLNMYFKVGQVLQVLQTPQVL